MDAPATHCVCGSPLFARYDLGAVSEEAKRGEFPTEVNSMWRYAQLLPVKSPSFVTTLGEGWTPLILTRRLGKHFGLKILMMKDETQNPTSSFKDRGLCVAVSKHLELGSKAFALPSAGNAGVSVSAYCAAAGVPAHVFMPSDSPQQFFRLCELYGANTYSVEGNISDCAKRMKETAGEWTDLSTTKEPYRVEGKKTILFEIAENLNWAFPDSIICPTGGGTAVIGIWKAIEELRGAGLVNDRPPKLYAVQSQLCAPLVSAFEQEREDVEPWPDPQTSALGLRVPRPFAGRLILRAIRQSKGSALAVSEEEISEMQNSASKMEGVEVGPEPAAALAGLRRLVEDGQVGDDEQVVVLNTGPASRYWS